MAVASKSCPMTVKGAPGHVSPNTYLKISLPHFLNLVSLQKEGKLKTD